MSTNQWEITWKRWMTNLSRNCSWTEIYKQLKECIKTGQNILISLRMIRNNRIIIRHCSSLRLSTIRQEIQNPEPSQHYKERKYGRPLPNWVHREKDQGKGSRISCNQIFNH